MHPDIVAQQKNHARYGPIVAAAEPFPSTLLAGSLVQCFEDQAQRRPEQVAVREGQQRLTYAALNAAANGLAQEFVVDDPQHAPAVPVVLDRGTDAIIALLAILKAGRHFMLLDTDLPAARLGQLCTLTRAPLLLTDRTYAAQVRAAVPDGCRVLVLEDIPAYPRSQNLGLPIAPDWPARLGFTSGSTGEPKAILRVHQRMLYSVWQSVNAYLLSPLDRHALVYRMAAGPAQRAVFSALLTGATLDLYPDQTYDMRRVQQWVDEHGVTQLYLPTAAFRSFLGALDPTAGRAPLSGLSQSPASTQDAGCMPGLRMVHVGGQTIFRSDAELFQRHFAPGCILVCRFSMSETGGLAHYLVDDATVLDGPTVPGGYALPGRELLVVDDTGQPVPAGETGEIAVRRLLPAAWDAENAGLARACATKPGANGPADLFLTGDLGVLRPDGCLVHLGRKDDVVKVRGFRVGLPEVEQALLQIDGVAQAAVKSFAANGDTWLAAYVVLAQASGQSGPVVPASGSLTPARLRQALAGVLPAYMVPARMAVLPELPFTATGKIDRSALALPDGGRGHLDTPYVAPSTPVEMELAAIWAEVLHFDEVGAEDNFLDLGGYSLAAARIANRALRAFHVDIPLALLFEAPTVAGMAALIVERQAQQLADADLEALLAELDCDDEADPQAEERV